MPPEQKIPAEQEPGQQPTSTWADRVRGAYLTSLAGMAEKPLPPLPEEARAKQIAKRLREEQSRQA